MAERSSKWSPLFPAVMCFTNTFEIKPRQKEKCLVKELKICSDEDSVFDQKKMRLLKRQMF